MMIGALGVWGIWPERMVFRTFGYDKENKPDLLDACVLESGILSSKWELRFPQQIELFSRSTATLKMIPNRTYDDASYVTIDVIVAANLEMPGAVIEPGETVFTAFDMKMPLEISWNIINNAPQTGGKLWIYAIPGETRSLEDSIPLFALPVDIQVVSFFGLEPRLIRIAGLVVVCVIFILILMMHQHRSE